MSLWNFLWDLTKLEHFHDSDQVVFVLMKVGHAFVKRYHFFGFSVTLFRKREQAFISLHCFNYL